MYTIYVITNKVNDKMYVGQTSRGVTERWSGHRKDMKHGADQPLYRAMRKYGLESFSCEPLLEVETKEEAAYQERMWIILLGAHVSKNGYVCTWGGDGRIGPCPETRWKRANSLRKTLERSPERHSRYRADVKNEEIVHLYVEEGWTRGEIAKKLNCSLPLIDQRMKKIGVSVGQGRKGANQIVPEKSWLHLKEGKRGADNPTFRKDLDTDLMVKQYEQGLSVREVATNMGCSTCCVTNRLRQYDVNLPRRSHTKPNPEFDVAKIVGLYQSGMTTREVGAQVGCSQRTVCNRLRDAGVSTRPSNNVPRKQ